MVTSAGAILLVRRGQPPGLGQWSLPGGKVRPDEVPAHAAAREVLEETGIRVEVHSLLGAAERSASSYHFVILDYLASASGRPAPRPADDASGAAWVACEELHTLDLVEGLLPFLVDHGVLQPQPGSF